MSNFTNSTTNRGVEAKEVEIANARLDIDPSESAPGQRAADTLGASPAPTGSYLQVVVEKHKRRRAGPARLATASSPAAAGDAPWPRARTVLLACPAYYVGDAEDAAEEEVVPPAQQAAAHSSWKMFAPRDRDPPADAQVASSDEDDTELLCVGSEPACVEVLRFERVGARLALGGAPRTRVEARAARAVCVARAAAHEASAAARLVLSAPLACGVALLRCALGAVRDAAGGALLALSDAALKPALALTYNALLHPPLVFVGSVLRGVRAALRPAMDAAAECAAAAAVLLRAVRLVEVNYYAAGAEAPCACRRPHPS